MNSRKVLLLAFVGSGAAALIYELVWIRPLQFILGSTIYAISTIFAAFMMGLALGSWIAARYVDKIHNLPLAYALIELGIGIYGVLLLIIFNWLPSLYRALFFLHTNFYLFETIHFLLTFVVILIPTALMGATFPIIARFYIKEKIGKGIGEIYFANNIGAVIGSFTAGFILIPSFGISYSSIIAASINMFIAVLIMYFASKRIAAKIIPATIIVFLFLIMIQNYDIHKIYASSFARPFYPEEVVKSSTNVLFYKEGLHTTVNVMAVQKEIALFITGYPQGSTFFEDMRTNFLLAYLPYLINPNAKNAFIIGLGTGTTAGQLSQFIKTTTVEIEPAVVEASKFFPFVNLEVTKNPNHTLLLGDARHYLLKNKEKYDILLSEPINTWQTASTSLFSKEFFKLVKEHLTEEGLFLQWVPGYSFVPQDLKNFYKTFNSEFPHVIAFVNERQDANLKLPASEILLIGSKTPIQYKNIRTNFDMLPEFSKEYFKIIQLESGDKILDLLLFTDKEMEGYGKDARIITDDNALLEFSTAKNLFSKDPEIVLKDVHAFLEKRRKQEEN